MCVSTSFWNSACELCYSKKKTLTSPAQANQNVRFAAMKHRPKCSFYDLLMWAHCRFCAVIIALSFITRACAHVWCNRLPTCRNRSVHTKTISERKMPFLEWALKYECMIVCVSNEKNTLLHGDLNYLFVAIVCNIVTANFEFACDLEVTVMLMRTCVIAEHVLSPSIPISTLATSHSPASIR